MLVTGVIVLPHLADIMVVYVLILAFRDQIQCALTCRPKATDLLVQLASRGPIASLHWLSCFQGCLHVLRTMSPAVVDRTGRLPVCEGDYLLEHSVFRTYALALHHMLCGEQAPSLRLRWGVQSRQAFSLLATVLVQPVQPPGIPGWYAAGVRVRISSSVSQTSIAAFETDYLHRRMPKL